MLRIVSGQQEPVMMEINVRNTGEKEELVSVVVKTPFSLGFDRVGLIREKRARIDYLKPTEEKTVKFELYSKGKIEPGTLNIEVKAQTHPDRYDRTSEVFTENASLRVIER